MLVESETYACSHEVQDFPFSCLRNGSKRKTWRFMSFILTVEWLVATSSGVIVHSSPCYELPYFTYLRSWALLEKLPIVQLLKNFPPFYGTRSVLTVFIRALLWSLSWARSIQVDSKGFWRWCITQTYWVFGLFPSSGILGTRKHDVTESGCVSVLRYGGRKTLSWVP
jgi:hypothetical protein